MKDDSSCVLAQQTELRTCENDADLCYAWFDRTGEVQGLLFAVLHTFSFLLSLSLP